MAEKIVIKNAVVVTMDERLRVFQNGYIVIEGFPPTVKETSGLKEIRRYNS